MFTLCSPVPPVVKGLTSVLSISPRVPNVHHVAVLHDVVFAFEAQGALGAGVGFGAGFEKLIPADGFGANEMMFQIGMNGAGALLGAGVGGYLPGAALVFAGGEE